MKHPFRILILKGDTMISSKEPGRWKHYEFHRTLLSVTGALQPVSDEEFTVDRAQMNEITRLVESGYDAVYGESLEVLLLEWMRSKKARPPMRYIVLDEDRSLRARQVNRWIQRHYGESPFPSILTGPGKVWYFTFRQQRGHYRRLGVPASRLFYAAPPVTWWVRTVYPAVDAHLSGREKAPMTPEMEAMRGGIVSSGQNDRDFLTLAKAMEGVPAEAHILTRSDNQFPLPASNVRRHAFLPMAEYIEMLRHSACLVLPIFKGAQTAGQTMAGLAMALGKPIVISRVPWAEEVIRHGISGLLVEPEDPEALRKAILFLLRNPKQAAIMGRRALEADARISARVKKTFGRLLRELTR